MFQKLPKSLIQSHKIKRIYYFSINHKDLVFEGLQALLTTLC